MRKALTILAASALAFGAAACSKSEPANTGSADDNMLVPADENSAMGDNSMGADNSMGGDMNSSSDMTGNASNAM